MSEIPAEIEQLSYEQAYGEIEQIVSRLESDTLSLENSLSLFERGKALVARCTNLLEQADLKVKQLTGNEAELDLLLDADETEDGEDEDEV